MSYGMIAVAGVTLVTGAMNASNQRKNREMAEGQAEDALAFQKEQQKKLDIQKEKYRSMEFKNPYANMENVFEDLTVNKQQAEFQQQQAGQQRANIMQNLKGAAGGSGVAGLAQALANQGALQTQRISASIGKQEASNQMAAAKGAGSVQIAERQGDQWVQQAEMDRQSTLLGMQMGEASGANLASQQAQANQMQAEIAGQQMQMDMMGTLATAAGKIDYTG